jgi:S1-C subfamily serine protease
MKRFAGLKPLPSICRLGAVGALALQLAMFFAPERLSAGTPSSDQDQQAGAPSAGGISSSPVAHVRKAAAQVYRLIVEVEGAVKGGTSFLVSGHRIVATNHHVVEKGTAFTLGFVEDDHRIRRIPLRLTAIYPQKDLALLEALDDLPGDALPLFAGNPDPATDLFAIGFPAAADPQGAMWWANGTDDTYYVPSVIKGYVSRVLPNRWFSSQLQHQTPIIPGYSGGPLVDNDGVVVGISTSVHKEANGISYAVLGADLAEFVSACGLPVKSNAIGLSPPADRRDTPVSIPQMVKTTAVQPGPVPSDNDRAMLQRANNMLTYGDIIAARLILDYLVNQRKMHEALPSLAKSYDPAFLSQQKVLGIAGDPGKAAALYKEAATFGDKDDKPLVTSSAGGTCSESLCTLLNTERGPRLACERGKL